MVLAVAKITLALGCLALCATAANAGERVKVNTKFYSINGATGAQLYSSMVKRGPRHGLTSRAIAQTAYQVNWDAEVQPLANGTCRVVNAKPAISITYTYPKPAERLTAGVQRRWSRFMAEVRKHEEIHGRIARQMVAEAVREIRGLKYADDGSCKKTRREMKRRADAVYAKYEAKQIAFDKAEHRDSGNIDRLILGLIK